MTTPTRNLVVRGIKLRTRTRCRYAVVVVRPEPYAIEELGRSYTYVAFAEVRKRSDNLATARREAGRYPRTHGAFAVVVDTTTGEEVV